MSYLHFRWIWQKITIFHPPMYHILIFGKIYETVIMILLLYRMPRGLLYYFMLIVSLGGTLSQVMALWFTCRKTTAHSGYQLTLFMGNGCGIQILYKNRHKLYFWGRTLLLIIMPWKQLVRCILELMSWNSLTLTLLHLISFTRTAQWGYI